MKTLIIDNYDSFTHNLYQVTGRILKDKAIPFELDIVKNDELTYREIKARNYDKIIISPGPGSPDNPHYFGVCGEVISTFGKKKPVFGVCLGLQGICHFFGGKVVSAKYKLHGKTSSILHSETGVFKNIPQHIQVMRYHSLITDYTSLPPDLEITAIVSEENLSDIKEKSYINSLNKAIDKQLNIEIMGLKHRKYPIEGVQFHPESFATEAGYKIIQNFIEL